MKAYEMMFILRPDLNDKDVNPEMEKIKNSILKHNGESREFKIWQRRKLAYPINKCQEGIYLLGYFKLPQKATYELSKEWRLNPNILRFLILKRE